MQASEALAKREYLIWHDITCPEGAECRSRELHAVSDNLVRAGLIDKFVELYEKQMPPRHHIRKIDPEQDYEHQPCARPEAHGGHPWEGDDWVDYWCEGVKAHPATMIGRAFAPPRE